MKKKDYFKLQVLGTVLQPIFLVITAMFFLARGWVTPEATGIVWAIIIIEVVADLGTLLALFLVEK